MIDAADTERTPGWREDFARRLLAWFSGARRSLPWRDDPSPYRVWISEIMLQQTQVDRVVPYFERFMARFPELGSLSQADESEVLALWSGLGYYRRARQLHAAARVIEKEHDGAFPSSLAHVLKLPGVGRYTAGAILSIAFNLEAPVLDGNVERVLTRVLAIEQDARSASVKHMLWAEAEALIPLGLARDFNQALMELGALVCTPVNPRCGDCPLESLCEARAAGREAEFPRKPARRKTEDVRLAALVLARRGCVAVTRASGAARSADFRGTPDYLRSLWTPPMLELGDGEHAASRLREFVESRWGGEIIVEERVARARHSITFRRIDVEVWRGAVIEEAPRSRSGKARDWRWAKPSALGVELPTSSLVWKVLAAVGYERPSAVE